MGINKKGILNFLKKIFPNEEFIEPPSHVTKKMIAYEVDQVFGMKANQLRVIALRSNQETITKQFPISELILLVQQRVAGLFGHDPETKECSIPVPVKENWWREIILQQAKPFGLKVDGEMLEFTVQARPTRKYNP